MPINSITLSDKAELHLLNHFYYLDNNYINYLKKKYDHKIELDNYLKVISSKFFKSFAQNPKDLLEIVSKRIDYTKLSEKRNELSIEFEENTGIDLLVPKDSHAEYSVSRKVNIILIKEAAVLNVLTIFPGNYAPPIPASAKTPKEFELNSKFWAKYRISSFSQFAKAEEENVMNRK